MTMIINSDVSKKFQKKNVLLPIFFYLHLILFNTANATSLIIFKNLSLIAVNNQFYMAVVYVCFMSSFLKILRHKSMIF